MTIMSRLRTRVVSRLRRGKKSPTRFAMSRSNGNLWFSEHPVPPMSRQLAEDGHCVIRDVFDAEEIEALRAEILGVYEDEPPDGRPNNDVEPGSDMYRYQVFNRSPLSQKAIAHPAILGTVEPLLGPDCHVISNTSWRNPPRQESRNGCFWHIDAGPHVPLPEGTAWPRKLPFPIFVIATHIYLEPCSMKDGPTGAIPGSHRSGRVPPPGEIWNDDLTFEGRGAEAHIVEAGDVGMFISDVWHRRIPPGEDSTGRFFLQTNYARRDIAQRILTTRELNSVSDAALARAETERERQLLGLHAEYFYDS